MPVLHAPPHSCTIELPDPGMIIIARGLRDTLQWLAVDLRGQRAGARLDLISRYVTFALEHDLIAETQKPDLVAMLVNGAPFPDAISELRAQHPPPSGRSLRREA